MKLSSMSALSSQGLRDRVGGRERHDRRRQQRRAEEAEPEEGRGGVAGQRFEPAGGVAGGFDFDPGDVQGGGAGDDHEEADDAGEDGADRDVDPLVAEVVRLQPLVDHEGLDEGQPPRRERGADRRHGDEQRLPGQRDRRDDGAARRGAPVGVGEDAGDDVGDEDRAERQQHVLDPVEAPAQHQAPRPRPRRSAR